MESQGLEKVFGRCMRNYAVDAMNSYVTDGCGEYVHDGEQPGEKKCKGCGCHRNFHEKVLVPAVSADDSAAAGLLNLASGGDGVNPGNATTPGTVATRPRTRFSEEQKQRMKQFAHNKGWKMGRTAADREPVTLFCQEIGISNHSFMTWMKNHKNDPEAS